MLPTLTMLNTDAFRGQNYRTELQLLVVGFLILFPGFFSFPLFEHHCIIFPHAVLCQSYPEEQIDLCEAPWTVLHIQLDAALLNKRGDPREPWTLRQGWWLPPNPASAESSVPVMFPPLPTGTSLRFWELILSALSVAVELTAKTDSEVFSNLSEVWHFHPLFSTGSGWSLLKAQLFPKPGRKTLLSLHGQIGAATGHCSPQPQMLSFSTQAILSHALDFGEAGSNSWRLSQEAAALDVLQCLFTTYICSAAIDLYSRQAPPQRGRFRSSVSSKQNQAPLYFALS